MRLFDTESRTDDDTIRTSETEYAHLNRSARVEFILIRDLLEQWFSHYPDEHKNALSNDFRSARNHQHQGAFFELFLHELLLRLDCKVNVHPALPATNRRVDFLVDPPDGQRFYMEATLATDDSAWRRVTSMNQIRPQDAVKRKSKDKAKRYGKLDYPYIIAVNSLGPFTNIDSSMEALFGDEVIVAQPCPDGTFVHTLQRRANGLWHNNYAPGTGNVSNTRVSAVLIADRMLPGNVASSPYSTNEGFCPRLRLYHNPWAERTYNSVLTRLSQARPQGGHMVMIDGEALSDIFGISPEWPRPPNRNSSMLDLILRDLV